MDINTAQDGLDSCPMLPSLNGLELEPCNWSGNAIGSDDGEYLTNEQRQSHVQEVAEGIHSLYKAGVPFFSKSKIQDLVHQMDRTNKMVRESGRTAKMQNERFVTTGLDGREVKFRVETGEAHDVEDGSRELVNMNPGLFYHSYQNLTAAAGPGVKYCSVQVIYRRYLRDKKSQAMAPLDELQTRSRLKGWPPSEEKVRTDFNACLNGWDEALDMRRRLEAALDGVDLPVVTNIVAFACATITQEERPSTRFQHVLLLSLRDILEARQQKGAGEFACSTATAAPASSPSPPASLSPPDPPPASSSSSSIKCFAQDPEYTETDKTILGEHGVSVLDDPRGFLEVNDHSAVLSFGPNICVRQIVTDIARPALLIWDSIWDPEETWRRWTEGWEEAKKFKTLHEMERFLTDPESPRVRSMIRDEYMEVMKDTDGICGSHFSVYVRKNPETTDAK